jgi:predicted DNA-binding mobile mystery protein A
MHPSAGLEHEMARTLNPAARRQAQRALERRFSVLRPMVPAAATPQGGWIRAIREALGMSAADLARRMGLVETSVLRLEANERSGSLRLGSLQRVAYALDCDLVVTLVPRRPLAEVVEGQARRKALDELGPVTHTMLLEGQAAPASMTKELLADAVERWRDRAGMWHDG